MKIDPIELYVKLYKFSFKRKLKPLSSEDFAKLLKVSISYYYGSIHSKESLIDEGFKYFLKEIKINSDIYLTLIQKYNLRFTDNNTFLAEDLYFCICYCTHVTKVISIDEYLYNYTLHSDSIIAEQSKQLNIDRTNELSKEILEFLIGFNDCNLIIEHFPIIHFMILDSALTWGRNNYKISPIEFRKKIYTEVQDVSFLKKWLRKFLKEKKELYTIYLGSKAAAKISYGRFLYDGNYLLLRFRNRVINRYWERLNELNSDQKDLKMKIKRFRKNRKCIYYIGSEEYGNLGDQEIAEAITKFSRCYFPDYSFIEITCKDFSKAKPYLQKYTRNEEGDTWLQKAQRVYSKENNVIIFTREKHSFQLAQKYFQCSSYLVPDIVLFCNEQQRAKRTGIVVFCFRHDKEKHIDEKTEEHVKKVVAKNNYEIKQIDLQLPYHVMKNQRREEIKKKMDEMRKSSLVITDRLHGMIFARRHSPRSGTRLRCLPALLQRTVLTLCAFSTTRLWLRQILMISFPGWNRHSLHPKQRGKN